jgi:hypothetical protein
MWAYFHGIWLSIIIINNNNNNNLRFILKANAPLIWLIKVYFSSSVIKNTLDTYPRFSIDVIVVWRILIENKKVYVCM